MADEGGQAALLSVFPDHSAIETLENATSRACWVYLNDPVAFRRAEEARYTDEHRRGRRWTGVLTQAQRRSELITMSIDKFKERLSQ